ASAQRPQRRARQGDASRGRRGGRRAVLSTGRSDPEVVVLTEIAMLKLCGFHISNYHNKVRIALLEKGVPFEEDPTCTPSQKDELLARTPMAKVPFLEPDGTPLAESRGTCEP